VPVVGPVIEVLDALDEPPLEDPPSVSTWPKLGLKPVHDADIAESPNPVAAAMWRARRTSL
jgi:hypothetical protein